MARVSRGTGRCSSGGRRPAGGRGTNRNTGGCSRGGVGHGKGGGRGGGTGRRG